MGLKYEIKRYPDCSEYFELKIGRTIIGHAVETGTGYLADNKRRPVKTLQEAAKQCLDSRMNMCMKEHEKWRKLIQKI